MCRVPVAAAAPAFAPPAWIDDAAATLPPDFTLVAPADLPPIDADDLSMLDAFLGSKIEAGVKAEPAPAGGGAATDALLASYGLGALGGPLTHAVAAGGLPEAVYGPRRKGKKTVEEVEASIERVKKRRRESAQRSRARKATFVKGMEAENAALKAELTRMRAVVAALAARCGAPLPPTFAAPLPPYVPLPSGSVGASFAGSDGEGDGGSFV